MVRVEDRLAKLSTLLAQATPEEITKFTLALPDEVLTQLEINPQDAKAFCKRYLGLDPAEEA